MRWGHDLTMRSLILAAVIASIPASALAWGSEGHRIIADIAYSELTATARAKVDAMLASDTDPLTAHDVASEATWADAYRGAGHRETAAWHFVDDEIDQSADLQAACFGYPAPDQPASAGPAQDCVVGKIDEFRAELASSATAPAERLLALKYLLHFVGDETQPLHASDNHDRGGNCVRVSLGGGARTLNLHSYWDTAVLDPLGSDPQAIAAKLEAQITPAERQAWAAGDAKAWALDSYQVAKASAYTLATPAGCGPDPSPIALPDSYQQQALLTAETQLEKGGVRLAAVLNQALGS
jgi:hypothetical protein